jgi:hypothetical protein
MTSQIRNELLDRGLTEDDDLVMDSTIEAIRDLLESEYAIAGYVVRDEDELLRIRSWEIPPADAVKRIEHDWSALGRLPKPGEIVWLELTHAGRAKVETMRNLDHDERGLVEEVITRRCPEMRERVSVIGQGKLNWEERQAMREALAAELSAVDRDEAYAQQLAALVDRAACVLGQS